MAKAKAKKIASQKSRRPAAKGASVAPSAWAKFADLPAAYQKRIAATLRGNMIQMIPPGRGNSYRRYAQDGLFRSRRISHGTWA